MSGDKCFKLLPHNFKMVSYFSLWDLLLLLSHYGGRLQYHDSSLTLQLVKIYMFFLFWDHHLLISKYCGNCKSSDTYILLFYLIWALKLTSITSLFHPIAHIHTALLFSIQTVSICGKKRKKKKDAYQYTSPSHERRTQGSIQAPELQCLGFT